MEGEWAMSEEKRAPAEGDVAQYLIDAAQFTVAPWDPSPWMIACGESTMMSGGKLADAYRTMLASGPLHPAVVADSPFIVGGPQLDVQPKGTAALELTCSHANRSYCALYDPKASQHRPSAEWYRAKIAETEGLDDFLPCGALAKTSTEDSPAAEVVIDTYADHEGRIEADVFLPAGTKLYARSVQAPAPVDEAGRAKLVAELMMRVGRYWDIAYVEGKEGRLHDTPAGDAQRALSAIYEAAKHLAGLTPCAAVVAERDALKAAIVELDAAEFAYAKFTRDEGMEKHRQNRERRIAAWQAARALVGLHDGSKPPVQPTGDA